MSAPAPSLRELYDADDRFGDACRKQFGDDGNIGRYQPWRWNDATKAAWSSVDSLLAARRMLCVGPRIPDVASKAHEVMS